MSDVFVQFSTDNTIMCEPTIRKISIRRSAITAIEKLDDTRYAIFTVGRAWHVLSDKKQMAFLGFVFLVPSDDEKPTMEPNQL